MTSSWGWGENCQTIIRNRGYCQTIWIRFVHLPTALNDQNTRLEIGLPIFYRKFDCIFFDFMRIFSSLCAYFLSHILPYFPHIFTIFHQFFLSHSLPFFPHFFTISRLSLPCSTSFIPDVNDLAYGKMPTISQSPLSFLFTLTIKQASGRQETRPLFYRSPVNIWTLCHPYCHCMNTISRQFMDGLSFPSIRRKARNFTNFFPFFRMYTFSHVRDERSLTLSLPCPYVLAYGQNLTISKLLFSFPCLCSVSG